MLLSVFNVWEKVRNSNEVLVIEQRASRVPLFITRFGSLIAQSYLAYG